MSLVAGVVLIAGSGCSAEQITTEQPSSNRASNVSTHTPVQSEAAGPETDQTRATSSSLQTDEVNTPDLKGLVMMQRSNDASSFPKLVIVDPDSGVVKSERSFEPSDPEVGFDDWYTRINGGWPYVLRRAFSPDYLSVVAIRSNSGGTGNSTAHAGYLDESGDFHDISELVPSTSDFQSTSDGMSSFDQEGRYWFARRPATSSVYGSANDISSLYSIDQGNQVAKSHSLDRANIGYSVDLSEPVSVSPGSYKRLVTTGEKSCLGADDAFRAKDLCVAAFGGGAMDVDTEIYVYTATIEGAGAQSGDSLLGSNNRNVKTPIFSPDGKRIAFLAKDATGTDGFDLYTISVDGGAPVKVPLDSQFGRDWELVQWVDPGQGNPVDSSSSQTATTSTANRPTTPAKSGLALPYDSVTRDICKGPLGKAELEEITGRSLPPGELNVSDPSDRTSQTCNYRPADDVMGLTCHDRQKNEGVVRFFNQSRIDGSDGTDGDLSWFDTSTGGFVFYSDTVACFAWTITDDYRPSQKIIATIKAALISE